MKTLAIFAGTLLFAGCASLFGMHAKHKGEERSIFGIVEVIPTERINRVTPLLETTEPTGGASFDRAGKTLFTANFQGIATAYDLRDQTERWRTSSDESLTMTPYYLERGAAPGVKVPLVIEGSQEGKLFALRASDGAQEWSYDFGGELRQAPVIADGRLLAVSSRNQCGAFDAATGKWLWQYNREFPVNMTVLGHSGVSVKNGTAYVGFSDGFVTGINLTDGLVKWARPLTLKGQGFSDADATPELIGDKVYAASFEDGVYALRADTGEVLWQLNFPGVTRLASHDPYLFAASTSGELWAIDADSGLPVWKFKFPAAEVTKPIVYHGFVLIGTRPGGLYIVQEDSGEPVQSVQAGGVTGDLSMAQGQLAFMSENSTVFIMRYGASGTIMFGGPHRFVGL
jgi:outer membrane protein assembly factor BamB